MCDPDLVMGIFDETGAMTRQQRVCLDDGPFYRRWSTQFLGLGLDGDFDAVGISELLDTRHLNKRIFNWMIPFRLKRPAASGKDLSHSGGDLR